MLHLYTSGQHACGCESNTAEATENPYKVTCRRCLRTKAYGSYLDGWNKACTLWQSKVVKVLLPLIGLSGDGPTFMGPKL